jgi:alkylation response protein AidB-like acyl-CoA dehydrogenase
VRRFAAEVMRPVGERLDKLSCGAGIRRDRPIEKIFRDARLPMIEDGCKRDPGHQG